MSTCLVKMLLMRNERISLEQQLLFWQNLEIVRSYTPFESRTQYLFYLAQVTFEIESFVENAQQIDCMASRHCICILHQCK